MEVLAARVAGSDKVSVLVINRQVEGPETVGGPGIPARIDLDVAGLGEVKRLTQRILDDGTDPGTGPELVNLPAATRLTLHLGGYGIALVQFEP